MTKGVLVQNITNNNIIKKRCVFKILRICSPISETYRKRLMINYQSKTIFANIEMDKTPMEEDEYGICCFCGEHCNPCSQACGYCVRKGNF